MSLHPASKVIQKVVENEAEVIQELSDLISQLSSSAINERGRFNLGLSGGSMAKFVCEGIPSLETDWSKWNLFFCDERLVPEDHEESTFRLYAEGLIGNTPLEKNQFVTVDTGLDVNSASSDYESKIRSFFPLTDWPTFDLLLLGMGPDGHTASLFPGHSLLDEDQMWIAPIDDSPKPPPRRVTMTLPVINHARTCIFAVSGAGKSSMIKRIFGDKEDLPSARVKPEGGEVFWIMDKEAASML